MPQPAIRAVDEQWLIEAIELSRKCPQSDSSFAVGAVIVDQQGQRVVDGYSLELGPRWHAEEVAFEKAARLGLQLAGCTLYSSLEPCSVRLSGKIPCVELTKAAGITRVVFALHEPLIFVNCQGESELRDSGITATSIPELGHLVKAINSHLYGRDGSSPPLESSPGEI